MLDTMLDVVAKRMDEEGKDLARDRQRRLVAALDLVLAGNQSELHRRLAKVEPKLALSTVQSWCRGPDAKGGKPMTELTLRAIMQVLGLPPDWDPKEKAS